MVRKIITYPSPSLRIPAVWVRYAEGKHLAWDVGEHIVDLRETLLAHDEGLAIASNQIMEAGWRMFVVRSSVADEFGSDVVINPTWVSGPQDGVVVEPEGCLSFPGYSFPVMRFLEVTCDYQTPDGERWRRMFSGLTARMIQHECDHLDGKLFIDQLPQDVKVKVRVEMIQRRKKGR